MNRLPIAFYAPLKPPCHPNPSGDRELARLFMRALTQAGFDVALASRFRSRDGSGDPLRQERVRAVATKLQQRLLRRYQALPTQQRPRLWFTYHLYHKAPDWIGPAISSALGIPYVVAEASYAPKRRQGPWALGLQGSLLGLQSARLILNLNPTDTQCLRQVLPTAHLETFPPFLDLEAYRQPGQRQRSELAISLGLNAGIPWLVCTAMMRSDAKLESYRLLAQALEDTHQPHHLLIIGDGVARQTVQALFRQQTQVRFLGAMDPIAARPVLESCDLFVWPAVNEAFGMALLEAQACGLAVVAGREGGVPSIVPADQQSLLVAPRDSSALAENLNRLLRQPQQLRDLGTKARDYVFAHHGLEAAASNLRSLLLPMLNSPQEHR